VTLPMVHDRLSVTAALFAFAMAAWAGALAVRGRGIDGGYAGSLLLGEALLLAQAALGAWLWFGSHLRPERGWIHVLYGVLAAIVWPFVLSLEHGSSGRAASVRFAAGSLFLWGLVMRAITTGNPG